MSIITQIKQQLSDALTHSSGFFEHIVTSSQYEAKPITADKFESLNGKKLAHTCWGIDGGMNALVLSPSFAVYIMRVGASSLQKTHLAEFVVLISLKKQGQLQFVITYFPINEAAKDLQKKGTFIPHIKEDDKILKVTNQLKIQAVSGMVRRILELRMAEHILLQKNVLVLLDGTLEAKHQGELTSLMRLFTLAKDKESVLCALSKTSSFVTTGGHAVLSYLASEGPQTPWVVSDILKSNNDKHRAQISFTKLHSKSKYIFRFETMTNAPLQDLLTTIQTVSNDPVFLGYPYVLIKADNLARVSNQDRAYFKTRLLQQLDELSLRQLDHLQASVGAHGVLDSIKF